MSERTYAYLIKDAVNISIRELCEFISGMNESIGNNIIQKSDSYVKLKLDKEEDLFGILTEYVNTKITPDAGDFEHVKDIVINNIDIFFEIDNNNGNYIIEIAGE